MALEKTLETTLVALAQNQLTQLFFEDVKKRNQGEFINSQTLQGHTSYVVAVAALSNGQVVSGSFDKTLKVWDVQNGQCLQTLKGHTDSVRAISVLPSGQVVSGSYDNTLKVWNVQSGQCLQTLQHTDTVLAVAALPSGQVISGSSDATSKMWDVQSGQCLKTLQGHTASVQAVAVLPSGQVVSGSDDRTLKVWDVKSGQCLQTLKGHTGYVWAVAALSNGQVVSGSLDNTLKVWDVQNGQCLQTLKGHTSYVGSVAALPNGQVVSGSIDGTLKVWDVKKGQCLQTLEHTLDAVYAVAVLPNGQVVSGSEDKTLKVWESPTVLTLMVQEQQALLQAVLTNTSLQSLNLSHIAFNTLPQGFELLRKIIQTHPTLHTLDLSHTGLTDTHLNPLLSALYNTKRIKNMAIEGNSLSHASSLALQQYFDNLNHLVSPIPLPSSIPKPQHTLKPPSLALLPSDLQHIAWNTLTVGNLLGHGGYGDVYQGQWQNVSVAIKELHLKTLSPALSADFEQEAKIMAQCHFPHVVRLYGVCVESGHIAMVMEYMPKESLYQVLHNEKEVFAWNPLRWNVAIDVGKGLTYLHGQKIIHRDLKSLNILLDDQYQAKISDFGLSKIKLETSTKVHKGMGTTRWRAPELFERRAVPNKTSDVYSYGMILWEIATRQLPFADALDDVTVVRWLEKGEKETIPSDCPKMYGDVIQQCWNLPNQRPLAQQALQTLQQACPPINIVPKPAMAVAEKSWHFDPETKQTAALTGNKNYALISATPKDIQKVIGFYAAHPVSGYEIGHVKVIYNPGFNRGFELHMDKLQHRHNNPAFVPKWSTMSEPDFRQNTYALFEQMTQPHRDPNYPAVKLLPAFHGTKPAILDSIFSAGYAALATTDSGFFGKGYYSAYEAEYSHRVYAQGALILNWVASFSALPVIDGDLNLLEGKGAYANYDTHFVPVGNENNPNGPSYYPCKPGQKHQYTEIVVFESAACLPRYLVELQKTLLKSPSVLDSLPNMPSSQTLINKIKHLVQQEDFSFAVKRVNAKELQIHFTAADNVLLDAEEIKKHLISLSKLLQADLTQLGVNARLRPEWKIYALSLTGETQASVDQVAGLLKSAGLGCWVDPSAVSSCLFFKPKTGVASLTLSTSDVPTVICAVQ